MVYHIIRHYSTKKRVAGKRANVFCDMDAKTALADRKAVYDAAKSVFEIVKATLPAHGSQIAEGMMEGMKLLQN